MLNYDYQLDANFVCCVMLSRYCTAFNKTTEIKTNKRIRGWEGTKTVKQLNNELKIAEKLWEMEIAADLRDNPL